MKNKMKKALLATTLCVMMTFTAKADTYPVKGTFWQKLKFIITHITTAQ